MENKTLYLKLHAIQEHIDSMFKNKSTNNYRYVDGNTVLNDIRPLMNANKLILKQEVLSVENTRQDYIVGHGTPKERTKSEILSKVMMKFTWVDCESGEKDENLFGANGMNDWDKGVGSALTYGERYFLLKYFHIPTDADDNDERTRLNELSQNDKPAEQTTIWLTEEQYNIAKNSDEKAIKAVLLKFTKKPYGIKKEWKNNLENIISVNSQK